MTAQAPPQLLLNAREAAAALGIGRRKLWEISAPRGPLAVVRVGRAVRYALADLEAFVESQRVEGAGK